MLEKFFQSVLSKAVDTFGQVKTFPVDTVILNEDSYIKFIPLVIEGS